MTAVRRRARPSTDFPPDAADAEPLDFAWRRHADPAMLRDFDESSAWLRRIYRRNSDPRYVDDRSKHVSGEFDVDCRQLAAKIIWLFQQITAEFLRKLLDGELTAWARSGSALASPNEVPATAAKVLRVRLEDLRACTAFGPNVALFDIHVGRRTATPLAAGPAATLQKGQPASAARQRAASTIAAEKSIERWLAARMRESPETPVSKSLLKQQARDAGLRFSERGFVRAHADAVKATGAVAWSAPGRKSTRRIDTPD